MCETLQSARQITAVAMASCMRAGSCPSTKSGRTSRSRTGDGPGDRAGTVMPGGEEMRKHGNFHQVQHKREDDAGSQRAQVTFGGANMGR